MEMRTEQEVKMMREKRQIEKFYSDFHKFLELYKELDKTVDDLERNDILLFAENYKDFEDIFDLFDFFTNEMKKKTIYGEKLIKEDEELEND